MDVITKTLRDLNERFEKINIELDNNTTDSRGMLRLINQRQSTSCDIDILEDALRVIIKNRLPERMNNQGA